MVQVISLSDEELLNTQTSDIDKKIIAEVLGLFRNMGHSIKIRTQWKAKDDMRPDAFRVFCYIGKSKESVIINTRSYEGSCFMLQIKIRNLSTLENLDLLSENIQSQIINARPCRSCGCPEKAYAFSFNGQTYRKCHMLCDNFQLSHFSEEDVDSVIRIVKSELMPKK